MEVTLLLSLILLLRSFCNSIAQQPDTKQLLDKIDNAVNNIAEGQFIIHDSYKKVSVGEDSTKRNGYATCFFKKLTSDSSSITIQCIAGLLLKE